MLMATIDKKERGWIHEKTFGKYSFKEDCEMGACLNSEGSQFRRFSSPKVLNSEGSQVRRFSIPKVLKSENQFSNDISIGSVRLCPSRLKLLSMCIINVDKYR